MRIISVKQALRTYGNIFKSSTFNPVAAGDIFAWGDGKCPNDGRGPNIYVSHTLNTVMTFFDL